MVNKEHSLCTKIINGHINVYKIKSDNALLQKQWYEYNKNRYDIKYKGWYNE